jgi:basic membrane protein A
VRKIIIIAFLILFTALAGIFRIQNSQLDTDVTAKVTKVGVLLSGPTSDRSYCQTHYEAIEAIKGDLNLNVVYRE